MRRLAIAPLLNVLAGTSAALGVNFITSGVTDSASELGGAVLLGIAVPWLLLAVCLAFLATSIDDARFEAALLRSPKFTDDEVRALERSEFRRVAPRVFFWLTLSGLLLALGLSLALASEILGKAFGP